MPTEALILRRTFPVPVTFADLRRAALDMSSPPWWAASWMQTKRQVGDDGRAMIMQWWHAAIKEATGALDEVYAVIDGREVRVATVDRNASGYTLDSLTHQKSRALHDLMEVADEAGYWQRPHEVRVDLEEPQMSHKTMARIAGNSFIVAGSK